ncbi:GNAT family N-acetyltransferase [Rhizobium sp. S163]|uniref:GNAT family N-acetyltransferase n=1 Tax=Rhizobium sp. S163 TaxID=3055039 RepID=UPI0025A9DEA0|nr:GNAT family N-acetyltransferase [Rhizobium sp. S163]MDM9648695.1 GNAT family N-acetyltransferase [Rhizobium sp. S163]
MKHILDRPIWSALQTDHAEFAVRLGRAWRYPAAIGPFAAALDLTKESMDDLAQMPSADEMIAMFELDDIPIPAGMTSLGYFSLHQLVLSKRLPLIHDPEIELLTEADASEMMELAELTKPGPFSLQSQRLGPFWGVKAQGKLVAMAGQRMRQPGFVELSGVCTHPEFRGRGVASLLSRYVSGKIVSIGRIPYVHVHGTNRAALAFFGGIGFELRTKLNLRRLTPSQ